LLRGRSPLRHNLLSRHPQPHIRQPPTATPRISPRAPAVVLAALVASLPPVLLSLLLLLLRRVPRPRPTLLAVAGAESLQARDPEMFALCQRVYRCIEDFSTSRGMAFAELRLIIGIESPDAQEARAMGLEDDSGCSRADLLNALDAVWEGRFPTDRLALQTLVAELEAFNDD